MSMRDVAQALLPVSLVTLLATACAGPAQPAASPQQDQVTQELTSLQHFEKKKSLACDAGKEHWRVQGTPKRGGAFIASGGATSMEHMDVTTGGGGSQNQPQVYEHLVETRACYYEDTVFVPGLAKSWDVSGDGLTWTLKLKDNVKWHNKPPVNGRAFTSADVAWTIEHQKAGGLLRSSWLPVTHETPDAHTVILRLKEPEADFLGNVLGERNNFILAREVKEQHGDFKAVGIGTGPYQVRSFQPKQKGVFDRVSDWREMGADGQPLPYIEQIDRLFLDYTGEIAAMRTGQIDLNSVLGFLKRDADELMKANPKLIRYLDVAPIPRGLYMMLDRKPFDDVRVRKALFYAIDHEDIVDAGYQGGALRTGHLPSAIADYAWPPSKVREKFKPDREQAKRLLAEAGYNPADLKFVLKKGNVPQDIGGEIVQQQLKTIGIDVPIEEFQGVGATEITKKNYHAIWSGVTPASIFPDRWMGGFLRCGDSRNYTNFCDPEVDRLSLAQGRELDPARRKVILDQLQDKLFDLMPFIPTNSLIYYRLQSCRVKNMPSTDYTQQLTGIAGAWLDPTGC